MKKPVRQSQSSFSNTPFQTAVKSHYRYPISLPEVTNIDALATMSDDDLGSLTRRLWDDREKVLDSSARFDTRPWDEELSYVKREQQIRRQRHEAHEKWLKELELEHSRQEINLPTADLDNSAFVAAAAIKERAS